MGVACVGGSSHPDADIFRRYRLTVELDCRRPPAPVGNDAVGECLPRSLILLIHRIAVANPVLELVFLGVWLGPRYPNRIDRLLAAKIDHYPLRVKRVVFSSKRLGKIRIALPVRLLVAIVEARIAIEFRAIVSCETSVPKLVTVRVPDHFPRIGVTDEVTLSRWISPRPLWVPVPRLYKQVSVLA